MKFKISTNNFENIEIENVKNNLHELYNLCLDESLKGNKVSFYFEDLNNNVFSYNEEICYYAASTIKVLVCLLMLHLSDKNKLDLNEKLLVKNEDIFPGSGIIQYQEKDKEYTLFDLIKLAITESDNTAYIKLMRYIGKEKVIEYGKSIGAEHPIEGKDSYGITNCHDMILYWKEIIKYIENGKEGNKLKEFLLNPSTKFIDRNNFLRKYGDHDIAYHEVGYVEDEKPYYMIILTQLNKKEYKKEFINKIAQLIDEINKKL